MRTRLEAIKERMGKATKGPWRTFGTDVYSGGPNIESAHLVAKTGWVENYGDEDEAHSQSWRKGDPTDFDFIAHSRSDMEWLVSRIEQMEGAAQAAVKYDDAIRSCANDPEKMASFCTAEGDNLDKLYDDWMRLSRQALSALREKGTR